MHNVLIEPEIIGSGETKNGDSIEGYTYRYYNMYVKYFYEKADAGIPKTGDDFSWGIIALCAVSALGSVGLLVYRRKRKGKSGRGITAALIAFMVLGTISSANVLAAATDGDTGSVVVNTVTERWLDRTTSNDLKASVTATNDELTGSAPDVDNYTCVRIETLILWYYDPVTVTETGYTARYLEEGTDKELATSKTETGVVGNIVTETAIDIADYTLVSDTTQDLTLAANSTDNVITFYYEATGSEYYKATAVEYTVRYLEEGTDKELATSKTGIDVVGETVTEAAIGINDYTLISATPQDLTLVENSEDNVITFYYRAKVNLTYDINNVYHSDYTGIRDTTQSDKYDRYAAARVDYLLDVFPNYADKCTFVGWNTERDGSGDYYYSGDSLIMSGDMTLYAIWKSCAPTIDEVFENDIMTTGTGVFGTGSAGALITITFPNGIVEWTVVEANGVWLIVIPMEAMPLESGGKVTVTQTELGKLVSDVVTTIIR